MTAASTPYPWPYHGSLDAERTALVITGGGAEWAPYVPIDHLTESNLAALRSTLSAAGVLVIVVVIEGLWLRLRPVSESSTPILPREGELGVVAAGLDGFYGSPLDTVLRRHRRSDLLIAGLGLETTVHSTVRRANDRGYECLTVLDAAATHDPALAAAARSTIEMSGGIFGAVGETADVLGAFGARRSSAP